MAANGIDSLGGCSFYPDIQFAIIFASVNANDVKQQQRNLDLLHQRDVKQRQHNLDLSILKTMGSRGAFMFVVSATSGKLVDLLSCNLLE